MELEIGRVIEACDARVLVEPESRDVAVFGLTWDSREVKPGFVYAAIVGERVDGHAFAVSAIEAGAVAVLCTRELDDAALEATTEKFKQLITENGGTVESVDVWGKRRLAYPINYETEGYYVLVNFQSSAELPAELNRVYHITTGLLRSIIVKK